MKKAQFWNTVRLGSEKSSRILVLNLELIPPPTSSPAGGEGMLRVLAEKEEEMKNVLHVPNASEN